MVNALRRRVICAMIKLGFFIFIFDIILILSLIS